MSFVNIPVPAAMSKKPYNTIGESNASRRFFLVEANLCVCSGKGASLGTRSGANESLSSLERPQEVPERKLRVSWSSFFIMYSHTGIVIAQL